MALILLTEMLSATLGIAVRAGRRWEAHGKNSIADQRKISVLGASCIVGVRVKAILDGVIHGLTALIAGNSIFVARFGPRTKIICLMRRDQLTMGDLLPP
jgi:hypothetical protein